MCSLFIKFSPRCHLDGTDRIVIFVRVNVSVCTTETAVDHSIVRTIVFYTSLHLSMDYDTLPASLVSSMRCLHRSGSIAASSASCVVQRYLFLDGVLQRLVRPPQCLPIIWSATDEMTKDIRRYVVPQDLNSNPLPLVTVPEAWSDYVESTRQSFFAQGVNREKAMVFIDWCCKLVARVNRTLVIPVDQTDGPSPYDCILESFATCMEYDVFPLLQERRTIALSDALASIRFGFLPPKRRPFVPLQIANLNACNRASS